MRIFRFVIPVFVSFLLADVAHAIPVFARQYSVSCSTCHAAVPRLNAYGEQFRKNSYRMPDWRDKITVDTGDEMLALADTVPLAFRFQAYVQAREGESNPDPATDSPRRFASTDIQAPYLIKFLSSAPLSDQINYYFYGILAEKGENGTVLMEDAWLRHNDVFGARIGMQLGQFQVSDLMFPRETRMTFQDFQAYRMSAITYDRALMFDRWFGPVSLAIGVRNGNGIQESFPVNSPGYQRPDRMFDNNSDKFVFGRLGANLRYVSLGIFGDTGKQPSGAGLLGDEIGARETRKCVFGFDFSGNIAGKTYWFVQTLWNRWEEFLDPIPGVRATQSTYHWRGGFAGIDYIYSNRWAYSLLYNYDQAGDFKGTNTIFEGIEMNSLALAASYYFMRNVRGVIEYNHDFLDPTNNPNHVGHVTREGYVLLGFDAAF